MATYPGKPYRAGAGTQTVMRRSGSTGYQGRSLSNAASTVLGGPQAHAFAGDPGVYLRSIAELLPHPHELAAASPIASRSIGRLLLRGVPYLGAAILGYEIYMYFKEEGGESLPVPALEPDPNVDWTGWEAGPLWHQPPNGYQLVPGKRWWYHVPNGWDHSIFPQYGPAYESTEDWGAPGIVTVQPQLLPGHGASQIVEAVEFANPLESFSGILRSYWRDPALGVLEPTYIGGTVSVPVFYPAPTYWPVRPTRRIGDLLPDYPETERGHGEPVKAEKPRLADPVTQTVVAPDVITRGPALHEPAHAPPGTKERKFIAGVKNGTALARILNYMTEPADFIEAVYDAIPLKYHPEAWKKHRRNPQTGKVEVIYVTQGWFKRADGTSRRVSASPPPPHEMLKIIYEHYDELDVNQALLNIAGNAVEDAAFGRLGQAQQKQARSLLERMGRPVGYGTGPAL